MNSASPALRHEGSVCAQSPSDDLWNTQMVRLLVHTPRELASTVLPYRLMSIVVPCDRCLSVGICVRS